MAGRGEHWDRDRYYYGRDRDSFGDDRRERFEARDHHYRGPTGRFRDHSDERHDRRFRDYDDFVRDRPIRDDDPRVVRREPPEYERRVFVEKDRDREVVRDISPPPPPRRPATLLRRQSSLDTFDRRPLHFYEREEYGPPARRDDYRAPPYVPIPLPRTRALPPPRRYGDRPHYDEIKIADPDYYGDEEYRPYPERIREREVIRTRRRRERSRDSATSRSFSRRSTRSSSTSSRSSSKSRTTARGEYPKKGKTRIPARLVSKRALIEVGYPFIEEGNTIIVLKALGPENIDELLKLSEEYKRSDLEVAAARSSAGNIVEERQEEVYVAAPGGGVKIVEPPVVISNPPPPPPPAVEVINKQTVIRDISPTRSTTSYTTTTDTTAPAILDAREVRAAQPLVLRQRSRSRTGRELRAEIRALEAEHRHGRRSDRDIVRAERLSDGQLVLYEEHVERVDEGYRGPRIEKDKKGRMSISVPRNR